VTDAPGYITWDGHSDDAANSTSSDLDREHPCANCGWGQRPADDLLHDDDACPWGYEPDLPAEETGEHLITDWFHYDRYGYPFFARQAEEDGDDVYANEPVWVLAAHCIKPGAEEGELQPRCEPTTIAACRELAEQMGCGILIGD
jgi:hypothetical protein